MAPDNSGATLTRSLAAVKSKPADGVGDRGQAGVLCWAAPYVETLRHDQVDCEIGWCCCVGGSEESVVVGKERYLHRVGKEYDDSTAAAGAAAAEAAVELAAAVEKMPDQKFDTVVGGTGCVAADAVAADAQFPRRKKETENCC